MIKSKLEKELNDAGFFKNSEDGYFHFDPMSDEQKSYRIYGNAQGSTLQEFARDVQEKRAKARHDAFEEAAQICEDSRKYPLSLRGGIFEGGDSIPFVARQHLADSIRHHASQQPHAGDLASAPLRPSA